MDDGDMEPGKTMAHHNTYIYISNIRTDVSLRKFCERYADVSITCGGEFPPDSERREGIADLRLSIRNPLIMKNPKRETPDA